MKRRLLVIIAIATLLVSFSSVTFADSYDLVIRMVDQANATIETMIEKAIIAANKITEAYDNAVEAAGDNEELIAKLTDAYNKAIQKLGQSLVSSTSAISESVIRTAAIFGVKVECYPVEVVLGNQVFIVDPLRVIDD
ncbi:MULTISPECIES: hypothetical protein [Kosmotoga]|uniref:Uncharacterized protein n=1 Tax=Kosmotoga olearia (strain ATCC BAA-1733 / DSM 21960 / TBF 19.5.1) TaxID=521045 RepID=C5CFZ4_KOSOT|nr:MULTISPECIES: hypothetical protein [Kosmotoga]ACR80488.1 hypothetical protein Kole_1804 [Kosmotoga olearia TBF 19.5.1]MDI3524653.1 hypothetical protein [Kosmotoga sp.]MDK2954453.1 hypothetical protein [Kosmotoga sp.]OAA19746.1 hypothetical protein DU53_09705 [Kosmotoga sp. DU53]